MPKKKATLTDFPVETVALADLKPHPRNYREHPEDQLQHIIESIREHGMYRNIVVARDYTILAGHGVVQALGQMGEKEAPIRRLDLDPEDPLALKVLTGDNEIEHLAYQDDRLLSELLKEISEVSQGNLVGTGFDEMMLAGLVMVTRPASEIADFDAAAHWSGMPDYEAESPRIQVIVNFTSEEDRRAFLEKNGYKNVTSKSVRWPYMENNDFKNIKFEGA